MKRAPTWLPTAPSFDHETLRNFFSRGIVLFPGQRRAIDPSRLPPREAWRRALAEQLTRSARDRTNAFVIWLGGEKPIGFSSINKIAFGDYAHMHNRTKGVGAECVKRGVPIYFEEFQLKRLFCEP